MNPIVSFLGYTLRTEPAGVVVYWHQAPLNARFAHTGEVATYPSLDAAKDAIRASEEKIAA